MGQPPSPGVPIPCGSHCRQAHLPTRNLTASQFGYLGGGFGFGHPAEAHVAGLLDAAGIEWEYEPHCYPIAFDDQGQPTRFFRPDLWLPESGWYLEITVGGPGIVNQKNRKLRLMAERHPEVRIRLLKRRDIGALQLKTGMPPDAWSEGRKVFCRPQLQIRRLEGRGSYSPEVGTVA